MDAQNVSNLKPRTIVELFDQAIRLYRNNFIKFIGIAAIALVPVQVIELLLNFFTYQKGAGAITTTGAPGTINTSALLQTYAILLAGFLLNLIFVNGVANAALTSAITSSYLGEKITIGAAYSKIRKSWWRLLGAMFLVVLLYIVFLLWFIVPCAGWFTGLGIFFFVALVVSPLVAPVVVVEGRFGSAIRRAWDLARRRFWWLIGYFLLIFIFNLLVIEGPVQLIGAAIQRYISGSIASTQLISSVFLQLMASAVLTLLLSLIYIPLQSTCATLVYFDLRIRQEGFDLAMMANQTAETPVDAVDLAGQTSANAAGNLVTWKEIGFFAAMSAITIGLYFIVIVALLGSQLIGRL